MRQSFFCKYVVTTFSVLTFLISWSAVFILFGKNSIPATEELQQNIGIVILLGPSLAALFLLGICKGKKGFKELGLKLFKWQIHAKWYVITIIIAPSSTLICIYIFSLFSPNYHPAIINSNDPSGLILLGFIGGIIVALFEEIGWTGFALPQLLNKFNIYKTGIIIGLLWGAWHFILFWENNSFDETVPFLLMLARLFAWLPAYRILMVWVYKNTQSLLIIILMHASLVASIAILDPVIHGEDLLIYILLRAAILWVLVAILTKMQSRKNRF